MYFPVLLSRAQVQYPVQKFLEFTFAEAESPGANLWRGLPDGPALRRWVLRFEDLTDGEADALASFYESCEGGWRSFSFADPMMNLLRWSEDPGNDAWGKSAGLTITKLAGGGGEPAEFQIVNPNATAGQVWQELDLAPGVAVCFSCEVRGGPVKLQAGSADLMTAASGDWARRFLTAVSTGGVQRVGLELEAGGAVQVRRIQAETQLAPSQYQGTFESGGIHARARFADGGLRIVSVAPDRNRAEVVLESAGEEA